MNSNLQTLQYYQSMDVRMVMQDGEPWWVLMDVCQVLGLKEPHRVAARLDEDERTSSTVIDSIGRRQETTIINESGLYSVILRSDKPEAKAFKRWVTHEVLPSIRRTGTYSAKGVGRTDTLAAINGIVSSSLSTTAQLLQLKLLELDRMQGGTGVVQISNREAAILLGVGSRHTIMSARRELIAEGLVEFTPGTKGSPSTYHLQPTR